MFKTYCGSRPIFALYCVIFTCLLTATSHAQQSTPATADNPLTAVEEAPYQTKNQSNQRPLNFPIRLNNKLAALGGVVSRSETPPTDQSYAVYDELARDIDAQLQKLAHILKTEIPAFNQLVREQNIPAIAPLDTCAEHGCRAGF